MFVPGLTSPAPVRRLMPDVFLDPERLAKRRETVGVTVVDVRREWAYRDGHLPGAVSVPFDEFRDPADAMPGHLPTPAAFASLLGAAGVGRDDHLVAYDDGFGVYAARLLVTAEAFGHDPDRLALLNGDYTRWRRDRRVTDAVPDPDPSDYEATDPGDPLVGAADLERILGEAAVVDTRDPVEYETVHLPGAVNLDWRAFVDEKRRRPKPADRCRELLAERGVTPDRPVRLYCNTARRLSFVYALLRWLGYEDVGVYEGGIDAWAAHGGPVATS